LALEAITHARVTVLGDYCLDAYWTVEPDESELSLETGLPVRRVSSQRYSPGGAGNVVANLKALGAAEVRSVGLLGEDIFGTELIRLLKATGIRTDGLLQTGDSWQTPLYAKPLWNGQELNRFDFGVVNRLSASQAARLAGCARRSGHPFQCCRHQSATCRLVSDSRDDCRHQ
jgi:bifunctional ADP-heptose synthase (sugar kinase/adenylyltransferase)